MPDAIPFFKTHNSIGKSILTVSDVFRLAGDNRLDSVVLIEDMMIGFPEALRLSKKTGIKLIYGIRFDICNSLEESYEDIVSSRCKMIAIMKNDDGYKDLIKLYTSVHTNDKKCIDYKILRDIWDGSPNIDFGLPFYDSFIAKNCLTLSNCLPDFGIKSPFVCVENNCHPFDDIVQDRVKQYCSINENRIVFCKSIYYENYDDFDSYTVYRLICGRSVYGNSTLDKPNLPHFGSNKFCFEDWKENRKCSFNHHPKEDFSLKDKRIILFDTETEGLNLRTSRPWQIAWVEMKNGKVLNKEMHYLAWDNLNVSKEAAAVTGFDKKVYDVKKENPKEIIDKFWDLIYQPDTILAGQNIIGFDIFILNIARKCIGYLEDYSFLYKCIDTVPLSRAYLLNFHRSENETMIEFCYKLLNFKPKGRISVKLSSMLDKFGIKYKEDKLHDALVDTEMTGELFIRLIRALGLENETCFINKDYSLSLENEYSQKLIENNQIYDTPMLEGVILPKADIPQDEAIQLGLDGNCSSYDFLKALCENGFKRLGIDKLPNFEDYKKRLDYELEVLEACGFIDYMLLNREIVRFCNSSGIPVGDGRGSAAGCLVFYLTGVTGIDPLEHNLIFERFVSMARAQKKIGKDGKVYLDGGLLADCDLDISYSDRSKVVDFVFQRFNGNACKILTVSTLSGKLCIKETMKLAGGYHEEDTKAISDLIPKKYGVVRPLSEAYETSKEFKEFCNSNEKIYLISLKLENLNKNTGVHPSGIAICAFPLSETMPLQTTKEGDLISGFEMGEVAEIMTKFDLLGLRTLTQIKETCDMLGINHKDIDYRNPEIYKYINEYLMPKGLFQIESDTNYRVAQVVAPDNLDELSDVVALARPGALAYVNDYVKAKNTGEMRPSGDEHMDSLLGQTKGILLFQETLMNIAHKIFGFTLERADALRKCVGKKQVEKMPQFEQEILDGAKKNGISEEAALYFWHVCQESANYSFNRSHSISYAATAAKTVYLKYWFPKEFFCTLLEQANAEPDPFVEIEKISQELPYFGIKLLPPDLANSHLHFAIEGDNIRYGLASIKGVSAQTLQKVVNFRNDTQRDICDIYNSAKRAGLSIGVLSSFAQAGLFDSFLNGHERCYMVYTLQVINVLTPRQRDAVFAIYKNKLNESLQDEPDLLLIISDCVKNETRDSNGRVLFRGGFSSLQDKCRKFKAIYEQNNKMPDFADWYYEKRVLGYAYSKNVKDIFADKSSSMTDCQEIKQLAEYTTVKIVGWASDDFQEGKSKKNGEKYWRFSINDDKGKVMCLMMDSRNGRNPSLTLSNYIANGGKRPHDGNIIVVVGSKSKDIVFVTGLSIVEEKIYSRFADLKDAE